MKQFIDQLKKAGTWFSRWIASQLTFSKIMVAMLVYKGIDWIDQSYALAWAGKDEIAESLSEKVVVEVIGVVVVYSLKALTETLSKNNNWPDKVITQDTHTVIMGNGNSGENSEPEEKTVERDM